MSRAKFFQSPGATRPRYERLEGPPNVQQRDKIGQRFTKGGVGPVSLPFFFRGSFPGVLNTQGRNNHGNLLEAPLFFGLDRQLGELFQPERAQPVSTFRADTGSNTFSISPRRSAKGETFLAVNSHQPWEGPVAWYEAHLHSEEGWDAVGGLFPGI